MPQKIAIVDDDATVRRTLEIGLARQGFRVRSAADGLAGLALIREWKPECIVLDIVMPKLDGLAMLGMVRQLTDVPIIMLSSRADVDDRVTALRDGADDFLAKPFDLVELTARVESALRRPMLHRADIGRYADLELDYASRSARRGSRWISLTTREFDLIKVLVRRPNRVFTRDELIELVWGADREVTRNTVEAYISYVRAKIDRPHNRRLIHTIRGVGYSLRLGEGPPA